MDKPEQPQNAGAASSSTLTSKPWLATFITLLGSSGLISVVGPVVGELYWEGYLQAFGLQPEEFPASSARVAVYAYEALLAGALAVGRDLWGLKWWGLGALLVVCIAAVLLQETPAHSRTTRLRQRLVDALQDRSAVGVSLRMTTVVLAVFASLTVVAYFALAALVMFVLPIKARTFGMEQGRFALSRALAAAENSTKCDRVQSPVLPAGCQWVIAFTDKQVAVFVNGRTYRVPREGTVIDSAVTPLAGASTARTAVGASK